MPFLIGLLGLTLVAAAIKLWWLLLSGAVLWFGLGGWWRSDRRRQAHARRQIRSTTRATAKRMRRVARAYGRSAGRRP